MRGGRRKGALRLTFSIFRIDPTYEYLIQSETPHLNRFWCQNNEKKFLLLKFCERRRGRRKEALCLTFSIFRIDPTYWYLIQRETHYWDRFWCQNKEKNLCLTILKIEKVKQRASFLLPLLLSQNFKSKNFFSLFWHQNLFKCGVSDWIKYSYVGSILKIEKVKQRFFSLFWHQNLSQ